jgi:hypothetical protein
VEEFPGKMNVVFQPFPLDLCNDAAGRKREFHPGACDVHYLAAHDPGRFKEIYDYVWENWPPPRGDERVAWIQELGEQFGVSDGLTDPDTQARVYEILMTGTEYDQTAEGFEYGIRSTPTMIINGRMVIGTLPYDQLRAIVEEIIARAEGESRFIEAWEG